MRKTCKKCGKRKSISQFYVSKDSAEGYFGACKPCVRQRVADHRAKNLDRIREEENVRSLSPERKKARTLRDVANKKKHPERVKAREILGNAVKSGKVRKPKTCRYSGCREKRRHSIEAHHEDYAYPLVVKWLCIPCHRQLHVGTTPAARAIQAVIAVP